MDATAITSSQTWHTSPRSDAPALHHLEAIDSSPGLLELQGHSVSVLRNATHTWFRDLFHFDQS